jgi:glycosyltransferase involved in cell wall biosynthesis
VGIVLVNGRYSARPVTGVERVAIEIVRHLTIDHRLVGATWPQGARGHLNEQLRPLLSADVRTGLLWSPANTGPVFHPRHVVTVHDVATIRHPEFFSARFRWAYRHLLQQLGRGARTIVAPSEFTAREIVDLGLAPSEKVVVIRNGVDGLSPDPSAEATDRPLPGLPSEYLLTVGSLDPRKNLGRLVSAYEEARRQVPLPPLLVAGGRGSAFAELPSEARSSAVRLLGRVSDPQLRRLYAGAVGVINVSVYEGFGLTLAETAHFEVPMVVSDLPAHREVLRSGPGVRWVDPWDVESIVGALRALPGADRGPHVVSGSTWAQAGEQYSALFEELGLRDS